MSKSLAIALSTLILSATGARATTYAIDVTDAESVGIVGTLTTDGAIGTIGAAQITNYELTFSEPSQGPKSVTLNPGNTTYEASYLTATRSAIFGGRNGYLDVYPIIKAPGIGTFGSFDLSFTAGVGSLSGTIVACSQFFCGGAYPYIAENLPDQIGIVPETQNPITGVPEISTWMMMIAGFASLSFAAFRSRKNVASSTTSGAETTSSAYS